MNTEQIIATGVKRHFTGQEVLFGVESLNEHFEGLVIYESNFIPIEVEGENVNFVKAGDISFDNATANEVEAPIEETPPIDSPVLEVETPIVETPVVEEILTVDAEVVSPIDEEVVAPIEEVVSETVVEETPAPIEEIVAPETPVVTEEAPADNVPTAKGK